MKIEKQIRVKIVQGEEENPVEVIAENIKNISEGIKRLRMGRLNENALVLLIQHACPSPTYKSPRPGTREVRLVLQAIQDLEKKWLKPKR